MKIGIITFWSSKDNYGQILQCYSLQNILKELGHEPFLIRFHPPVSKQTYSLPKLVIKFIFIIPLINFIIRKNKNRIYRKNNNLREFDSFKNNNIIQYRHDFYNIEELKLKYPIADCYITGSDQVWAMPLENHNNRAYFLDFGNDKSMRISYAASFGMSEYPLSKLSELSSLLKRFNAISVRESDGISICKKVNTSAVEVLDPTLLLNKDFYISKFIKGEIDSKYAFTYFLNIKNKNEIRWNEVYDYLKQKNIKSIATYGSGYFQCDKILSNTTYVFPTIDKWLNYIFFSEFVITTSFHGVVFSILLNKNFIYFPLKGVCARGNNRVYSLLDKLSLLYKIVNDDSIIENIIEKDIDWNYVNNKLKELREQSIEFLIDNLKL